MVSFCQRKPMKVK